jgi:nitrite reductase/ring-hydroxylating ferredoxin subunit
MSVPEGFVRVAALADLRPGRGTQVLVDHHPVALWVVEGDVHAIDGLCPHQHIPTMHLGIPEGNAVACPMHGWTFRLDSGEEIDGNGRIPKYEVLVEQGEVFVGGRVPSVRGR